MTATDHVPDTELASILADYGVVWLGGHEASEVAGDCPHDCKHVARTPVAVGPTKRTTRLVECGECGCRVWLTDTDRPAGRWQQVCGPETAESTARRNRIAAIRRRAKGG